jgi:hypothetical protein
MLKQHQFYINAPTLFGADSNLAAAFGLCMCAQFKPA